MAWSYETTNIVATTAVGRKNCVRLLVGDTDTLDQQLQDEEIDFALSQSNNNIYYAGSWAAGAISASYARKVTTQLDAALKADYSDLHQHYAALQESLRFKGKTTGSTLGLSAGGITITAVEIAQANPNRVQPEFRMNQFKNPPRYNPYEED
jgi:hypothetical protein